MDDTANPPDAPAAQAPQKKKRRHPFAGEASGPKERDRDARAVTALWLAGSALLALIGYQLQSSYGYVSSRLIQHPLWEPWTLVPLFTGIALIAFGASARPWAKRLAMSGWVLFAAYWALVARDLFIIEGQDWVNAGFAFVGVFFFTYLSYQTWLDLDRGVHTSALRFLSIATALAAGFYFLFAKIPFLHDWLILTVGDHTDWMLGAFGQGQGQGLEYWRDPTHPDDPARFAYTDHVGRCPDGRVVWSGTASRDPETGGLHPQEALPHECTGEGWSLLWYSPGGETLDIVPVSIVLACTALQSIMLFVGLIAATRADWKKKLAVGVVITAVVYVLNLVRNTGIIWFYGQGHSSFYMMHNVIGKGGSLVAMVLIAFAMFRIFPQFLDALLDVLDLKDRDGPIERALRLGRKRPDPVETPA